jgi:hypothetical protein
MEMDDVELSRPLRNLAHHQHEIQNRVTNGLIEPQRDSRGHRIATGEQRHMVSGAGYTRCTRLGSIQSQGKRFCRMPPSASPSRARTSPIVWCLRHPMARKPLMHNYIFF